MHNGMATKITKLGLFQEKWVTLYLNMKEGLSIFMTTVIKCRFNYDICNANMTLFEMSLL